MKIRVGFNIVPILKIVSVLSVISQIGVVSSYVRPLMFIGWAILALLSIMHQHGLVKISKATKTFLIGYVLLFLYCLFMETFSSSNYLGGTYFRTLLIPLTVVITAETNASDISEEEFVSILKWYVAAAFVYAIYVNVTFFPSLSSWLNQVRYIFDDKNSAAQIWSSAALLALYVSSDQRTNRGWVWKGATIYLLVVIALSQCRTAILGLAVGYLFYIIVYAEKKVIHLASVVTMTIIALSVPKIYSYVYKVFFISNQYALNVDVFSSGRLRIFQEALTIIKDHFLTGIGNYYVDCSYLMIICETGIIGFVIIEFIWMTRIRHNIGIKTEDHLLHVLSIITIFFIICSLLEGLPPFGPGVASFMFWFLSGYAKHRTIT